MDITERLGCIGDSLRTGIGENSEILFFILVFLILFTDFFHFGHGLRE